MNKNKIFLVGTGFCSLVGLVVILVLWLSSPVSNFSAGKLKEGEKNKIQEIAFSKEFSSPSELYFKISIQIPSGYYKGKKSSTIFVCPYGIEKNDEDVSFLERKKIFRGWQEIIYLSSADLEKVKAEKQAWEKANPPPDIHLLDEE